MRKSPSNANAPGPTASATARSKPLSTSRSSQSIILNNSLLSISSVTNTVTAQRVTPKKDNRDNEKWGLHRDIDHLSLRSVAIEHDKKKSIEDLIVSQRQQQRANVNSRREHDTATVTATTTSLSHFEESVNSDDGAHSDRTAVVGYNRPVTSALPLVPADLSTDTLVALMQGLQVELVERNVGSASLAVILSQSLNNFIASIPVTASSAANVAAINVSASNNSFVSNNSGLLIDPQAVESRKDIKRSRSAGGIEKEKELSNSLKKVIHVAADFYDEEISQAFGVSSPIAPSGNNSRAGTAGGAAQPVDKMFAQSPPSFHSLATPEGDREDRTHRDREKVKPHKVMRSVEYIGLDEHFARMSTQQHNHQEHRSSPFSSSTSAFEDRSVSSLPSLGSSRSSHTHTQRKQHQQQQHHTAHITSPIGSLRKNADSKRRR